MYRAPVNNGEPLTELARPNHVKRFLRQLQEVYAPRPKHWEYGVATDMFSIYFTPAF